MAQKYTEARKEGNRKWDAANLDRLSIALPKGSRETIKAHAAAQGESTNAFIKRAIDCQMERDNADRPQGAQVRPWWIFWRGRHRRRQSGMKYPCIWG